MTKPVYRTSFHCLGTAVLAGCLFAAGAAQAADACSDQAAVLPHAPQQAPGIGGTGQQAAKPGVGGTGIDGGVGGTGIVGVITGFASVCVNGVEVHFDADTPISEDGKPAAPSSLALGKLVAIQATGQGEAFSARSIAVMNTLVGPVAATNTRRGELQVLGQTVLAASPAAVAHITPGQWVQVSGYRQAGGAIEASYVAAVAPQAQAQFTGWFERNMGIDVVVSGVDVRLDHVRLPAEVSRGSEVTVAGDWDGNTLRARSVVAEPTRRNLGSAREVLMEGLVRSIGSDSISLGQRWSLGRALQVQGGKLQDLGLNQRVRVQARVDDNNRVQVNRIEIRDNGKSRDARSDDRDDRRSGSDDRRGDDRRSDDRSGRSGSGSDDGGKSGSGSNDSSKSSDSSGKSSGSGSSGSGSGSNSGSSGSGGSGSSGGSGKDGGK